jgi:hypothetical protein
LNLGIGGDRWKKKEKKGMERNTKKKGKRKKGKKIGEKLSAFLENMICNFTDYIIIK